MSNESDTLKKLYEKLNSVTTEVCNAVKQNNERAEQYEALQSIITNLSLLDPKKLNDTALNDDRTFQKFGSLYENYNQLADELKSNNYNKTLVEDVINTRTEIFMTIRKLKS